ncbi:MAG: hypothetical protein HZA88_18990 [Verrucomicrobia bacterium]|nr:hypothetical protein [Verrucomicrobiota bacterium]
MSEKRVLVILMWLLMAVWSSILACCYASEVKVSGIADVASGTAFAILIVSWVYADASLRQRRLCYDYDTFLFFAWPLLAPCYLFQTRGLRGFLTLLYFAIIWLTAGLCSGAVYWILLPAAP